MYKGEAPLLEKEGEDKNLSFVFDKIYDRYGKFDFSILDKEKQNILFKYFSDNLDEFTKDQQLEILESFMQNEVPEAGQVTSLLNNNFESIQKGDLGIFIEKVLGAGKYTPVFHNCYNSIPLEEKEVIKNKILKIPDELQNLELIAPFCNLVNYEDPTKPNKILMKTKYGNVESAKELMDSLISLKTQTQPVLTVINNVVDYYFKNEPIFLLPYASKLIELEIFKPKAVKDMFKVSEESDYSNLNPISRLHYSEFFKHRPKEEELELKKIEQTALLDSKEQFTVFRNYNGNLKHKYEKVFDQQTKRNLKFIFKNFSEIKKFIPEESVIGSLKEALDNGTPIFYVIEELGLNNNQVRELLRTMADDGRNVFMSDMDDFKKLLTLGYENELVTNIIRDIVEMGADSLFLSQFIKECETIFPMFSDKNREKIINRINKQAPGLWFYNINQALNYVSFDDLIESAKQDHYLFFNNYLLILNLIKKLNGPKEKERKSSIQKFAKKTLKDDFGFAIYSQSLANAIFRPDEIEEIFNKKIKAKDTGFVLEIFKHYDFENDKQSDKVKSKLKKLVLENQEVLEAVLQIPWWRLTKIFIPKELTEIVFNNLYKINTEEILDEKEFLEQVTRKTAYQRKLALFIKEAQKESCLPDIMRRLTDFSDKIEFEDYVSWVNQKPKRRKLNNKEAQELENLKKFQLQLEQMFKKACEQKNFLVFNIDNRNLLKKLNLDELADKEAKEYIKIYPDEIYKIVRVVSNKVFVKIVSEHIRTLFFNDVGYEGENIAFSIEDIKDPQLIENINQTSPFQKVLTYKEDSYFPEDYYTMINQFITKDAFYSIYEERLLKIIEKENDLYGPRKSLNKHIVNQDFMNLVRQERLLSLTPIALENKQEIFNLIDYFPEESKEILGMLEMISFYGLDKDRNVILEDGTNIAQVKNFKKELRLILIDYFKDVFELENIEIKTTEFFSVKLFKALSIYYTKVCRENTDMKKTFGTFLSKALAGNYNSWRSWDSVDMPQTSAEQSECLEKLKDQQLVPEKITAEQYQDWVKDDSLELETILKYQAEDLNPSILEIFNQSVVDNHINKEDLLLDIKKNREAYQQLFEPIEELNNEIKDLKKQYPGLTKKRLKHQVPQSVFDKFKQLTQEYKEYINSNFEGIENKKAWYYLSNLIHIRANDLEIESIEIDGKMVGFKELFSSEGNIGLFEKAFGEEYPEFYQDIVRIGTLIHRYKQKIFGDERISRSNLTVTDKVDLTRYIRIGKEPVPSCQSFDSNGDYNVGLLSYVTDPNVKVLQVYDEAGQIIARSILRLLEDKKGNPQLFLERVYSVNPHPKITESIIQLALEKSKKMGVNLYSFLAEADTVEKNTLVSKNSRSQAVYSDAAGGVRHKGNYIISNAFKVI